MEVEKRNTGAVKEEEAIMASGLPLAGASQQHYVSELLSFTLDRLHKVHFLASLSSLSIAFFGTLDLKLP